VIRRENRGSEVLHLDNVDTAWRVLIQSPDLFVGQNRSVVGPKILGSWT
jgi:hypothetical protein